MQIIYKNKDKEDNDKKTSTIGFVICVERISRHLERKI